MIIVVVVVVVGAIQTCGAMKLCGWLVSFFITSAAKMLSLVTNNIVARPCSINNK